LFDIGLLVVEIIFPFQESAPPITPGMVFGAASDQLLYSYTIDQGGMSDEIPNRANATIQYGSRSPALRNPKTNTILFSKSTR
jgi:hypothetical protein